MLVDDQFLNLGRPLTTRYLVDFSEPFFFVCVGGGGGGNLLASSHNTYMFFQMCLTPAHGSDHTVLKRQCTVFVKQKVFVSLQAGSWVGGWVLFGLVRGGRAGGLPGIPE